VTTSPQKNALGNSPPTSELIELGQSTEAQAPMPDLVKSRPPSPFLVKYHHGRPTSPISSILQCLMSTPIHRSYKVFIKSLAIAGALLLHWNCAEAPPPSTFYGEHWPSLSPPKNGIAPRLPLPPSVLQNHPQATDARRNAAADGTLLHNLSSAASLLHHPHSEAPPLPPCSVHSPLTRGSLAIGLLMTHRPSHQQRPRRHRCIGRSDPRQCACRATSLGQPGQFGHWVRPVLRGRWPGSAQYYSFVSFFQILFPI
jgi:hypothetical protein